MLVMGSMIGSGIFIVSAEISPRGRFARSADRGLAGDWLPDHRRGPQLRRTGCHDAARRRSVCLPARSAGAAVGISLRLDALSGDPDRDHCRRRCGLRQVSRHLLSFDFFLQLDRALLESAADPYRPHGAGKHGDRAEHAEPGGHSGGSVAVGHQYLRPEDRRADSERFHLCQGFRPAGSGFAGIVCRTQCAGAGGKFSGKLLAQRGPGRAARGAGGSGRPDGAGGHADHSRGGPGRIAVFRRRLEQRDFHRRRSEESQPQSAAVAGAGHGRGDCALRRLQLYLSEHPAAGWQSCGRDHSGARHQVRHRRPRGHGGHVPDVGRGRAER